jgi:hypothetical protein
MRTATIAAALATAAALVLGGCSDVSLSRPTSTEVHFQNPPTAVDILLVVDDSGSMDAEQGKLSRGFESFVRYFDVADVDYHIGVTTTDMDTRRGALADRGGTKVISRDTEDPGDVFADNVRVGIVGSADERGFDAASTAISDDLAEANEGFLREDALLSIIFLSDEEDASYGPTADWLQDLRDLKGPGARRDAVNVSALVGVDPETGEPADCGQVIGEPNEGAFAGHRYVDVALATGGVVGSICLDEYDDIISDMGLASSRLRDRFTLRVAPVLDTLEVRLFIPDTAEFDEEGLVTPPEGVDGEWSWVYEEEETETTPVYRVRFLDAGSLPPVATRVVIRYEARP